MTVTTIAAPRLQAQDAAPTTEVRGRCDYPERIARYRYETTLVLCDTLFIRRDGGQATIDFRQRGRGSVIRFTGAMPGDRMAVSQMISRDGSPVAASGTCEIFYAEGKPSTVACLARSGSRSWATNFMRSRI